MKNLVLGAAKGYGWDILEPFVTSCKRNCPDAQIVLFIGDNSDFTRDKLTRAGIRLEKFSTDIKGIPNNTRWKIILDFLERCGDEYETIFVTDTRDVIFQGNLFAAFDDCKNWLGFATELDDLGGTLTGNRINYNWLVECFGKAETDKLVDQKVICSGTIIGSSHELKTFCRELWRILEPKVAEGIFDQAAANWLVYNGRVPVENIFDIGVDHGEIYTNGLIKDNKIRGDKILRGDGGVPEVVHQYDRHENLIRLVDELYRDKNISFDERFTDPRSTLEQVACLLYADKISEATRHFMKKFLSTENLGTYVNLLMEIWTLALRKDFSPTVEMLEVAAQNSLLGAPKFSDYHIKEIHKLFVRTAKSGHTCDPEFKNHFASRLRNAAEYHFNAGNVEAASTCKRLLDELDARS